MSLRVITSFLLMASRRSSTTSSPSQSVALKPLVQVTRIPCRSQTVSARRASHAHLSRLFTPSQTYGVQAGLVAGEGEGEAQRQTSTFHPHVVQEVGDAVDDVVEELGGQTR